MSSTRTSVTLVSCIGAAAALWAVFATPCPAHCVPPPNVPHGDDAKRNYVEGKTAAAGFVNLLRRNISQRDLLAACFAEWKKSAGQSGKYPAARLRQAEAIFQAETALPTRERRPIQAYREICAILQRQTSERAVPPEPVNTENQTATAGSQTNRPATPDLPTPGT